MSKGVKKIKWSEGNGFSKLSIPNVKLVIPPNEYSWFVVGEWEAGITEADKKKNVTWMRQDHNRKTILNQMTVPYNQKYGFQLPKNLCGSYTYYIEASISGKTSTSLTGLYVGGHCATKIVKTFWTTKQNSLNETENHVFSFGEVIFLQLNTEGLNGDIVIVEIYNKQLFGDKLVRTITQVQVIDGEVNVKISNSYLWKGQLWFTLGEEEFYAKIKNPATGQYISDSTKESSKIFKIKNEIVTKSTDKPTNIVPLKIGKVNVNAERYEPCKFDSITIKEKEKKDGKDVETKIVVFEKGKKLTNVKHPDEDIVKSILFEFDSVVIHPEGQKVLNNVLQFLLEHQHSSISLNGYACVIGKNNYNLPLSKRRADAVKKFLEDGKLDKTRIVSVGNGEAQYKNGALSVETNDNKNGEDNLKNKDEKINTHARRVDIAFKFYGHDAQTIVYETIAPSKNKDLKIEVMGFDTKSCFRQKGKEHTKKIKITSPQYPGPKSGETSLIFPVHSDLSAFNLAPLNYIWPKFNVLTGKDSSTLYNASVHSCRYFSVDNSSTVLIKAYPDIKWNLELSFNFSNAAAYTHSNLPEYSRSNPKDEKVAEIIRDNRKAQSKAVSSGIESKRIKNSPEMLTKFELKLEAKWNNGEGKFEKGHEFAEKIRKVLGVFIKYKEIADKVKNSVGGAAKKSPLSPPFMFEVQSPSLNANIDWYLEKGTGKFDNQVATVGKLNFKADPLIGAAFVIDLLAVGSRMHPFIAAFVISAEMGLSALNGGITFEAKFYGKLSFDFNAIEMNSLTGIVKGGVFDLGAEMGVEIKLKIGFDVKIKAWVMEVQVKLRAEGAAKAYFAAKVKVDCDEKGFYYKPELGFSGLIFTFEAEIVVGGFKRMLKFGNDKDPFLKADVPNLEKHYFNK